MLEDDDAVVPPTFAPPKLSQTAEVETTSPWCQRWTHGRHSWRHVSEGGFDARRYLVESIPESVAKSYVVTNHYARTYPAAAARYGLFDTLGGEHRLAGVAVFGIPVQASVLTLPLPLLEPYRESLELSRFVLDDSCPGNAESWFLARCFEQLLARGVRGVVSFADPVPRPDSSGALTAAGHVGTIYQASGAAYTGRGTPRSLILLRDGTALNSRSAQKVRSQEQGHEYVETRLVGLGARPMRSGDDPVAWLQQALDDCGARRIRHRGPHRYVFRLGRNQRERDKVTLGLPDLRPYPKQPDETPFV